MTVGYDLHACARLCVSDLAPQPQWESLAVFWTLWVIPHCVSVSHLARWTTTTPYSFPLYTSIIPSPSRDRQKGKDILLCTAFCSFLQEIKKKDLSLILQPQARAAQQTEQAETRLSWNPLKIRLRNQKWGTHMNNGLRIQWFWHFWISECITTVQIPTELGHGCLSFEL